MPTTEQITAAIAAKAEAEYPKPLNTLLGSQIACQNKRTGFIAGATPPTVALVRAMGYMQHREDCGHTDGWKWLDKVQPEGYVPECTCGLDTVTKEINSLLTHEA